MLLIRGSRAVVEIDERVVLAVVEELRAQADGLETLVRVAEQDASDGGPVDAPLEGREFDPLVDEPPIAPKKDNKQPGYMDPVQIDWCGFLLWGGLYAANVREGGRFATAAEARVIAQRAGYVGNGAWTGTKEWKQGTLRDVQGGRMITERGKGWLRYYRDRLGVRLPADLPGID